MSFVSSELIATLNIVVSPLNMLVIRIGTTPSEPDTVWSTIVWYIPSVLLIPVNDLTPWDNRNSNSISPFSKVVINWKSLSLIILPLPAAISPIVASNKLSPLPELGKSNLRAGNSVLKALLLDKSTALPFIYVSVE